MVYLILLPFFFIVLILYFRVADYYNIIDKPNERSSHAELTIRGGGVIYLFAALVALILHPEFCMSVLGIFVIGVISFVDDRITLSRRLRILCHLGAVTILFMSMDLFGLSPWWACLMLYIPIIGIINAYNFMDGINGITGLYSLIVLLGLQYVNFYKVSFIKTDMIWLPALASIVFLFFNFRKRAKCFAGDVGSISVAFWIILLLLSLIIKTQNYSYILFLALYGVDTVLTIIHRLVLKQNIFEAHRLHFYQILANDRNISHLVVSGGYAITQLLIIVLVVFSSLSFQVLFSITVVPLTAIYIALKPHLILKSTSVPLKSGRFKN